MAYEASADGVKTNLTSSDGKRADNGMAVGVDGLLVDRISADD